MQDFQGVFRRVSQDDASPPSEQFRFVYQQLHAQYMAYFRKAASRLMLSLILVLGGFAFTVDFISEATVWGLEFGDARYLIDILPLVIGFLGYSYLGLIAIWMRAHEIVRDMSIILVHQAGLRGADAKACSFLLLTPPSLQSEALHNLLSTPDASDTEAPETKLNDTVSKAADTVFIQIIGSALGTLPVFVFASTFLLVGVSEREWTPIVLGSGVIGSVFLFRGMTLVKSAADS